MVNKVVMLDADKTSSIKYPTFELGGSSLYTDGYSITFLVNNTSESANIELRL